MLTEEQIQEIRSFVREKEKQEQNMEKNYL
jgi:hypothetical protein